MLADQAAADGGEEKKEEKQEPAVEAEQVDGEGEEGDGAVKSRASARSAAKQKRPATDK